MSANQSLHWVCLSSVPACKIHYYFLLVSNKAVVYMATLQSKSRNAASATAPQLHSSPAPQLLSSTLPNLIENAWNPVWLHRTSLSRSNQGFCGGVREGKPLNTVKLSIFDILIFPIVKVRLSIMLEIPTILLIVCLSIVILVCSLTSLLCILSIIWYVGVIHGVKG